MTIDVREWIETDGLGGFAMGTASGLRTRRYHGLLVHAVTPPTGRMVLVNGFDAWIDVDGAPVYLSTQRYAGDVIHPDGAERLESFTIDPWPTWRWRLWSDVSVVQELFVRREKPGVVVRWRLTGDVERAMLRVRPFLSGRDYHALHHENPVCDLTPRGADRDVEWHPYPGVPGVRSRSNAQYRHAPDWYRHFFYSEERARGLDDTEDLASPGELFWDLTIGEAVWVIEPVSLAGRRDYTPAVELAEEWEHAERDRRQCLTRLTRAADQYLVRRGSGSTIVAGYPWFTDWGRDTFIALRGLCIATGWLAEARDILLEWAGAVSEGMLPNRFPDGTGEPEYNAVDASLWFVIAVHDLIRASARRRVLSPADRVRLMIAVEDILRGYSTGTRFGIRAQPDGLLASGVPGVQLTWMDSRVGERCVTSRIGKAVEVQALWLNALAFAGSQASQWQRVFEKGRESFQRRFWNEARHCLYDVIDADHADGHVDDRLRPNQIFAVGGLPQPLITGDRARAIVDVVERELVTPAGLRTLARSEAGYAGHYAGGPDARDEAYHQGTVWPWLMGAFVDAWVRVRGNGPDAREAARDRFVTPLLAELDRAGLGHLYEVADGDAPHTPRGCPFQAWSVGELLRLVS